MRKKMSGFDNTQTTNPDTDRITELSYRAAIALLDEAVRVEDSNRHARDENETNTVDFSTTPEHEFLITSETEN